MPQVFGWSEDDFEEQAQDLAALIRRVWRAIARLIAAQAEGKSTVTLEVARPIPVQWQQALDDQIVGFVRNVYLDGAGAVSDEVNAPDEMLIGDDLVEVYTNAARNRLVGIGDDVWKNVQAQITLGNQLGEGIHEIAARIRNVAGVSEARSLTIARTEVHAAFESGAYEQAMFVDPNATKIWLATEDERTRPSHRRADGQKAKIDGTFTIGEAKLRFPGDPLGEPGETINCRCSVAYDFDMITTVVEEPEPAMTAAGQIWKAHEHPRGNDGKFIEKGAVSDFLKKASPNIIDVQNAVSGLTPTQWSKLTNEQKIHIEASVDKLPKGTKTHETAKAALDKVKSGVGAATGKPLANKPDLNKLLAEAKHGDVIATGTKYNSAGAAQKFKITADKSHVASYMPNGKFHLQFIKKDGTVGKEQKSSSSYTIHSALYPLPVKGKKPGKVEWDEPGDAGTADVPKLNTVSDKPVELPGITPTAAPTKIPAGLKGKPGDPAKITTGVVWGKNPPGTTIVESHDGVDKIVWNGKKFEFQSQDADGQHKLQYEMTKKEFYENHKGDNAWVVPGGTPQNDGYSTDEETGQLLDDVLGPETTPEPPQTPSVPEPTATAVPDWTKHQDFSGFTKVGGQAGSNPGGKYKAPDGSEWYVKKPKSSMHASNEQAAAAFYNLAGISAPQVMKGNGAPELGGNLQTGTKMVPGAKANLGSKLNDQAYIKEIQSGFAMDAWLANWDVAGLSYDNVVEGADGKPHRIDVGGALLYRAQGSPKGDKFGNTVDELETLRNPGMNPTSAKIFGPMTDEDIRKSAAKVEAISEEQIDQIVKDAGLPSGVADTLKARRKDILSKYPPIKDEPTPTAPTAPTAESAKEKLDKLWDKGLITSQEYFDATGENPPGYDVNTLSDEPDISHVATSGSGALYYLDQGEQSKMVSSDGKYVLEKIDSPMGKYSLETKGENGDESTFAFINNADDVDYVTGDVASLWYPAKPKGDTSSAPSGTMISGNSLGLKPLHSLIVDGKHAKKYSDGQAVATSPDGERQLVWRDVYDGYLVRDVDTGSEDFISNIHAIKMIRDQDWHVPENLLMDNHGGKQVEKPARPDANDPISDTSSNGVTNSGAMFSLENGDAEVMTTIDGKYEMYKSANGQWTALKENHPDGTATVNLVDNPDEVESLAGLQVWYPKHEIEQSINAPDATAGVDLNKPVDLDIVQEKIDSGDYSAGEIMGITQDGQYKIMYSPIVNGIVLQHKIGNTGDDDMDWDTLGVFEGNADTMDTPVSELVDNYPNMQFFEPSDAGAGGDAGGSKWDDILTGSYAYNDVVAQTGDGKFQIAHVGMGQYAVYKKNNFSGVYQSVGTYNTEEIHNGELDPLIDGYTESRWEKVAPGTPFKSGKTPLKKTAKAAKKAGVPSAHSYSAATVSPGEKKFYLEDAGDGSLVPSEAIHLLNGEGGLNLEDAKKLTGAQTANINKQLEKAVDGNMPGSAAAWQKWAELENQLNADNDAADWSAQIVDQSYLLDMEDEMWGGNKSFGDVIAITPDGKQRLVIHSTEGPGMNPDSFALETHGPLGWETTEVYKLGNGTSPHSQFWNAQGHKSWVIPDSDSAASTPSTPSPATTSFDPPGTGTAMPGTLFDMLDWVPEDKPLLVGKTTYTKFVMVAGKDGTGKKVLKALYWNEDTKKFDQSAVFDDEATYNWWAGLATGGIKWDAPGTLTDKSALEANFANFNKFNDDGDASAPEPDMVDGNATPSMTTGTPLSGSDNVKAWGAAQNSPVGTILALGKSNNGNENVRMVVKENSAGKFVEVQKQDSDGDWLHHWDNFGTAAMEDDFVDEDYTWWAPVGSPLHKQDATVSNAPNASNAPDASESADETPLSVDDVSKIWDAVGNSPDGTVLAVGVYADGSPMRMLVDTNSAGKHIRVEKLNDDGTWTYLWNNYGYAGTEDDLGDYNWLAPAGSPLHAPSTPATPSVTAPSAPSAPTAPSGGTPFPLWKTGSLKNHLKANGNLGYYSKPENIWKAVKDWQAQPGNEQYSPMDLFKALDGTLKTSKPNPFQEKMTKWATTKKGAQIIGADGIYGPAPSAPSTPSAPSAPSTPSAPKITANDIDNLWVQMQGMADNEVIAEGISDVGDKYRMVISGTSGYKHARIQKLNKSTNKWDFYTAYTTSDQLKQAVQYSTISWTKGKSKPTLPDIEAGNDISGIDQVKQKSIFDKFKSQPYTYLSSPEHSIFDAAQDVAKSENLTLAQVINIIDEQGAKKVNKPNAGLFKQKLSAWLKTPEAAAHILNEPEVVNGLPKPPAFSAKYDPYLNPGQIPSFEESSKLDYKWVDNHAAATSMWNSMIAKTEDITPSQKKGLTTWSGGAYTTINGYLFKPNQPKLGGTHQHSLIHSQQGMRPVDRPVLLVRGTGFSGLGNAKNHAQLEKLVGTTWRNNAYAATSIGSAPHDAPGVHSPAFSSFPLWIEFECPPGTPMAWLAPFSSVGQSEREMLLAANLHYKILSVEKKMIPGYGMKSIARVRIVPKPEGAADE